MFLLTSLHYYLILLIQTWLSFFSGRILLVPSIFNKLSSVFFGRLQKVVLSYSLPKTLGLEGLSNFLLRKLEDFAVFTRILVLMRFLSNNLA